MWRKWCRPLALDVYRITGIHSANLNINYFFLPTKVSMSTGRELCLCLQWLLWSVCSILYANTNKQARPNARRTEVTGLSFLLNATVAYSQADNQAREIEKLESPVCARGVVTDLMPNHQCASYLRCNLINGHPLANNSVAFLSHDTLYL